MTLDSLICDISGGGALEEQNLVKPKSLPLEIETASLSYCFEFVGGVHKGVLCPQLFTWKKN